MNSKKQKIVNLVSRESRGRSRVSYLVLFDRSVVSKSNIIVHVKVEHGSRLSSILVHDEIVYRRGKKGENRSIMIEERGRTRYKAYRKYSAVHLELTPEGQLGEETESFEGNETYMRNNQIFLDIHQAIHGDES